MSRSHRHLSMWMLSLAAIGGATACAPEGSIGADPVQSPQEATRFTFTGPRELPPEELAALGLGGEPSEAALAMLSAPPAASAALSADPIGTSLNLLDNQCQKIALGFQFWYYGEIYDSAWVTDNGSVSFGQCHNEPYGLLPRPGMPMVAPATGDWFPTPGTDRNVFVATVGSAPARRLIVTWHRVQPFSLPGDLSTFRLILHETSNRAEFEYPSIGTIPTVSSYRAGINRSSTRYVLAATNKQIEALEGRSLCFTPVSTSVYEWNDSPCPLVAPPNSGPVADAGGPYAAEEGSPILFNASASSDPDGDALTYAWTFGDGASGSGEKTEHVYADQGEYPVSLVVADGSGESSEAAATAKVFNVAPAISLGAGKPGIMSAMSATPTYSGEPYTLTASFTDPGLGDAPWRWTLDWGNGDVDSGETTDQSAPIVVQRRLLEARSYDVTLVVQDKDGGSSTAKATISVDRFPVGIDIKPGDDENALNTRSRGKFWVAILSAPGADAADVLPSSVRLGGASGVLQGRGILKTKLEDVDADGDLDLLIQFETQDLVAAGGLGPFTQRLELQASYIDGRQAGGSDHVRVVK